MQERDKMNYKRWLIIFIIFLTIFPAFSLYAAKDYMVKRPMDENEEAPAEPVTTEYKIDVDGDKRAELIKVKYGPGVSDKYLTLDVYKDGKLISTLEGEYGQQSNYKIEDVDKDGRKEIIIWSGIWDPRIPGEDGITEETYEGHSAPHRYIVATYKLIRSQYYLWEIYTTKKKYEPFCEDQPK